MIVYPAIDLQGGQCVRLFKGNLDAPTVYATDPLEPARRFAEAGATWLHVVDLDAASDRGDNRALIASIVRSASMPVQVGGGFRDAQVVEWALNAGVARVVIGTAAIENADFTRLAIERWGERIAIGVDARQGKVATRGWQTTVGADAGEFVATLEKWGASTVIYTDIDRDGTLTQPNFDVYAKLVAACRLGIIASGGIAAPEHLTRLRSIGVAGAIVGKALYTGSIDLRTALAAASDRNAASGRFTAPVARGSPC